MILRFKHFRDLLSRRDNLIGNGNYFPDLVFSGEEPEVNSFLWRPFRIQDGGFLHQPDTGRIPINLGIYPEDLFLKSGFAHGGTFIKILEILYELFQGKLCTSLP